MRRKVSAYNAKVMRNLIEGPAFTARDLWGAQPNGNSQDQNHGFNAAAF
jgi:hypothetical protein